MPKLPQLRPKNAMKALQKKGFTKRPGKGSHVVLKHPDGRHTVVPIHNKSLSKGTLKAILRQSKVSLEELLKA